MVPPWREPEQFTSLLFDALILYAARTRILEDKASEKPLRPL